MDNIVRKAAIGTAALVGAKYLDAKMDVRNDFTIVSSAILGQIKGRRAAAKDRCNFFYILEDTAKAAPKTVFIVYQGKEWTYHETLLQVQRYGNYFLSLGIRPRDHVAMDFTNKPEFLFVMYGLLSIGAVPALINFNLMSTPLMHCITAANANTLIFDIEIAANVAGSKDALSERGIRPICLIDGDGIPRKGDVDVSWAESVRASSIETEHSPDRPPDSLRSGPRLVDMEMLMFTSGTTGLPKPAIISFNKMGYAPILFVHWAHLTPKDRFYTCMPLYHATALILGASLMVLAQGTLIIGHKFHARTFWQEVRESKATVIQYVGEMCRYLLATPPSDQDKNHLVRMAFGNGMRPDVWNRFRHRFGVDTIAELYAATEGNSAQVNCSSGEYGSGCIGRAGVLLQLFSRKTVVIVKLDPITEELQRGPDGLCVRVKIGEPGELLFYADPPGGTDATKAFQGYYGNKDATEKKIARDVLVKGDMYFRTGDVIRQEKDGLRLFTHFEDRIGDTFRWKGENVSTMEVGAVIGAYPGVADANVYGVRLPNHDGRAGCCAISFHDNYKPDFRALSRHLHSILPRYAIPVFLRVTKVMVLTGNMKHQKHGLREEGIDPKKTRGERIVWLKNGEYVDFTMDDWEGLQAGRVKL